MIRATTTTTITTTRITPMLDDFILRAAAAGTGLSLATGPLGAMVLWRRMAYFGDATAHAAILGVALALALNLPIGLGTLAVALAMALGVATLAARGWAVDTTLGVLSHGALALGLVAVSLLQGVHASLESYLFGDILAVTFRDLAFIWTGALIVLALLAWRWQRMLTATVNAELAEADGINPDTERLILTLALALVVAVALKVVGALLIAAMLVIPAAAARPLSRSPEQMAGLAMLIGAAAALGGLGLSLWLDTPAGPSIVTIAAALFIATASIGRALQAKGHRP
jgi:zinc transport system permease protein